MDQDQIQHEETALAIADDPEYLFMKNDSFFNYSDTEIVNPFKKRVPIVSTTLALSVSLLLAKW